MNEDKIIFYTVGCPHCTVLEHKLKKANIQYEEITDIDIMEQKGFTSAPMLQVNDEIYDFVNAIKWLTERKAK